MRAHLVVRDDVSDLGRDVLDSVEHGVSALQATRKAVGVSRGGIVWRD